MSVALNNMVVPCTLIDCMLLQHLQGTLFDIVGTEIGDRGWKYHTNDICSEQLVPRSKVHFWKETMTSAIGNKVIFMRHEKMYSRASK